jgi:hypothetical protein
LQFKGGEGRFEAAARGRGGRCKKTACVEIVGRFRSDSWQSSFRIRPFSTPQGKTDDMINSLLIIIVREINRPFKLRSLRASSCAMHEQKIKRNRTTSVCGPDKGKFHHRLFFLLPPCFFSSVTILTSSPPCKRSISAPIASTQ